MKIFVRICWLVLLFAGSLLFFGNRMTERFSDEYVRTIASESAKLPLLSLKSDGVVLNTLYGYATELDPCTVRGDFTISDETGVIEVLIDERQTDVRKLMYGFYDVSTGELLEEGQISAFDVTDSTKNARLKPGFTMETGVEYTCALTLITSESKRVYYYFRFKKYDDAYLNEKVAYMKNFSEACRAKNIEYVIPYLESTYRGAGTNYAEVDIKDSYYMVCWGDLEPTVISDIKVSISEIYKYIAVGTLKYMVAIETSTGHETYVVTENFRINLGTDYAYLLNYDRKLEAVFDPALISLSQAQIKLGVTNNTAVEMTWSQDKKDFFFVRNNILWHYNLSDNMLIKVYSMVDGYDNASEVCENHEICVLSSGEDGSINFFVKGYVNCGEYEGKNAIILYRYYSKEARIEELLYIPLSESAEHVAYEVGEISYMNKNDVFFFMAYNRIYSYNLSTKELNEITGNEAIDGAVFCEDLSYVAWQESGNFRDIYLLYLETGEEKVVSVEEGQRLTLLGAIGDKLITGKGNVSDGAYYSDGSAYYPISTLQILDSEEKVVKEYYEEGFYITGVEATSTSIRLTRVVKTDGESNTYSVAPDDYILIFEEPDPQSFSVTTRATKDMLTEYYIALPSGTELKNLPKQGTAKKTVISENSSLRMNEHDGSRHYEIYSFGQIIGVTESITDAITLADTDKAAGVVTKNGRVVWERGVQTKAAQLSEEIIAEACQLSANDILELKILNHLELKEMFYFIYKNIPVYAIRNDDSIIVITGYDGSYVSYRNLSGGKTYTEKTEKLIATLEKQGNIFRADVK